MVLKRECHGVTAWREKLRSHLHLCFSSLEGRGTLLFRVVRGCQGPVMRWRCRTDVNGATHLLQPPLPGIMYAIP